jgi:tetratricopeptide (TPR) repeat protein
MSADAKKTLAAVLALVVIGFGLYANTLESPFVFDDTASILTNPHIEALWPLSHALDAPPGAGSSGRPLVSLSLALNYAAGGREVLGYHLFNIATLVLSALTLFGLARRLMAGAETGGNGLAFALALVWMVHPLHTDTLNHVVYRNGSMMGLFYLLALYSSVRSHEADLEHPGESGTRWSLACVFAAAAAMACKEVAVSLPLAVLALDRQFGAGSFRAALTRRRGMYAGLAATWGVLALCVWSGNRGESVGYGHSEIIDGLDYLRTQAVAIATYARLTLLSGDFVFDYHGQEVVREWSAAAVEVVLIGLGLALSVWGFARRSIAGLLGLAFFALLAPTSSVIPLAGELIGEHRMYLPLVPLAALVALLVHGPLARALGRVPGLARVPELGTLLVALLALPLAWTTVQRNGDYASRVTLWQDTVEKRPDNSRAWNHLALALKNEQRLPEAEAAFQRTLEIDPAHGKASYNYGNLLFQRGELTGAVALFASAARHEPDEENIRFNHGYVLMLSGRGAESITEYRAALELRPGWEQPLMLLSWTLATSANEELRDGPEALRLARELNAASGNRLARHLDTLAAAQAELGDFAGARETAQRALEAARALGNGAAARDIEQRLRLYESEQPFRQR